MKKLIFLIMFTESVFAQASLLEQARNEERWTPIEIQLPGNQNVSATGFLTQNGEWRLHSVANELQMSTPLKSAEASQQGLKTFKKYCERWRHGFVALREENRKHAFTLQLPNWESAVQGQKGPQTLRLTKAKAALSFNPGSYTLMYSRLDPQVLERLIDTQVQAGLDKLKRDGVLEINIDGHDYLACDLVTDQVQVGLDVAWDFAAAKLKRQATVGVDDVLSLAARLRAVPMEGASCEDKMYMVGGLVATGMELGLRRPLHEMMPQFLRYSRELYDKARCDWRDSNQVNWTQLAGEFDRFSEERTTAASRVWSRFNGEVK